ncbi:MAG TPA: hypothetical protein VI251_04160 [Pseudolabrys sp.]|jgi:hypothetical protein
MRKALTIGLAAGLLAATLSFVAARSRQQDAPAYVLPSKDILVTLSAMGLDPIGQPLRRGPYFVLHAYDRRGIEVRVVADAQLGDILSVVPVRNVAVVSPNDRAPRIIHVPQPGEERASVPDRDEPEADSDDDDDDAAPRGVVPKPQTRKEAPAAPRRDLSKVPSPAEGRTVLSAPPPPANSLTPIYPTPRFTDQPAQ